MVSENRSQSSVPSNGGAYGRQNRTRPAEHVSGFELGRGVRFVFGVDAATILYPELASSPLHRFTGPELVELVQPKQARQSPPHFGPEVLSETYSGASTCPNTTKCLHSQGIYNFYMTFRFGLVAE